MSNTIERIDAATIFVGDDDPNNSLHLKIKSVGVILDLEEATMSHKAGGHVMTLEMGERSFTMGTLEVLDDRDRHRHHHSVHAV